ncbi:hypothetical protein GBF38_018361, partial [Nibea albiflora]
MASTRSRRAKVKPREEAAHFSFLGKDKDGFEVKYINSFKGRGVFSRRHFEKGDFLVEYRGELLTKHEHENRQQIYHDALKVFMFEFRFNGKQFCPQETDPVPPASPTSSIHENSPQETDPVPPASPTSSIHENSPQETDPVPPASSASSIHENSPQETDPVPPASPTSSIHENSPQETDPVPPASPTSSIHELRNKGNYEHNAEVKTSGTGLLKLRRQPKKMYHPKDYVHCMYCQALYLRRDLWRHVRKCLSKPVEANAELGRTRVLSLAKMSESTLCQQISKGVWKLLTAMKDDDISAAVRSDYSILQLGQSLFNRHGQDPTKCDYIRQKLREVGRLLLALRKDSAIYTLEDAVNPKNFHVVIKAVKKVSGFDEEKNSYQTPSLALKLDNMNLSDSGQSEDSEFDEQQPSNIHRQELVSV